MSTSEPQATPHIIAPSADVFERVCLAQNMACFEWYPETGELRHSKEMQTLFGVQPERWTAWDHAHPDDLPGFRSELTALLKGPGDRGELQFRAQIPGRGYRWCHWHLLFERNAEGRAIRVTGAASDIHQEVERESENRALLARQAASMAVLQAISGSPGDPQPAFALIVRHVRELAGASTASILRYDGGLLHRTADDGYRPDILAALQAGFPRSPGLDFVPGRVVLANDVVQVADLAAEPGVFAPARGMGARSYLGIPLRREGQVVGVLGLGRADIGVFEPDAVALAQSFAEQAVIALENARLVVEQREALEYQDAISGLLRIVSTAMGELAPVFDGILERAHVLCGAEQGSLQLWDGTLMRAVAVRGHPEEVAAVQRAGYAPGPLDRLDEIAHIHDVREALADGRHPAAVRLVWERTGLRTMLRVPLLKDGKVLGRILAARSEMKPFDDKQIALLQNFADQAVIAIENARLLTEQREALERQTATAEVLQVINAHPGELQPVFEAMLERAVTLCGAALGTLRLYRDERFFGVAGFGGFDELAMRQGLHVEPGSALERILNGEAVVHIADLADSEAYRQRLPGRVLLVEQQGARTALWVALRRQEEVLGVFIIFRREVRPFTERQIALVQDFAAQAVIAMENARLLDEQREALERQTATAEVLQVINANPGNLAPVFDAMLERAVRLCEADLGSLSTVHGDEFTIVANHGAGADHVGEVYPIGKGSAFDDMRAGRHVVHILDCADTEAYRRRDPGRVLTVEVAGARTALWVALRREGALIGAFLLYRRHVEPFTDRQIDLLQSFAAQAVIAMENARLLDEQREALERQTATAEVLGVINANPGNLAPVFAVILEKAHAVCGAAVGGLFLAEDGMFRAVAAKGYPAEVEAALRLPRPPGRRTQALSDGARFHQTVDIREDAVQGGLDEVVAGFGVRTSLLVPLREDGRLIGWITANRLEVRPYTEAEIALIESFAAQAVIAMENARLLGELRESLDRQTATAAVMQTINANPGNVAPVFDMILAQGHAVCGAAIGAIWLREGENIRAVALRGFPPELAAVMRMPRPPEPVQQRLLDGERYQHFPDLQAMPPAPGGLPVNIATRAAGIRTVLRVPLRKDDMVIGFLTANRLEVRPYSEPEIALLEGFAAQAAIAIENARLLGELRESLERQTATNDVLRVINASPGDLRPVFEAVLEKTMRLCDAACGVFLRKEGDLLRVAGERAMPPALLQWLIQTPLRLDARSLTASAMRERRTLNIADTMDTDAYREGAAYTRAAVDLGHTRSMCLLPLATEEAELGIFAIFRQEVRPFTEKQVALVQSFADQAVIAMENARLMTEQREALERQTATAEVLQVINANPGELVPVFEAMLERAIRLCNADFGYLLRYEGGPFRIVAGHGDPGSNIGRAFDAPPGTVLAAVRDGEAVVQIADLADTELYRQREPSRVALVEDAGARTVVWVALRREDELLGVFLIYRRHVGVFTDRQVGLIQNFADQAVIAMENARLMTEQREALERQTATAEVLQVINANPGELAPVFEIILQKAHGVCGAEVGGFWLTDGETIRAVATHGYPPEVTAVLAQPISAPPEHRRLIEGEPYQHIHDYQDREVTEAVDATRAVQSVGVRTVLRMPLRRDGRMLGFISANRLAMKPYTEPEIALLRSFADQAVIAMDNARLLEELRARTAELAARNEAFAERIDHQAATIDVLKEMSASPADPQPVFNLIARQAHALIGGPNVVIFEYDGELVHRRASAGSENVASSEGLKAYRDAFPMRPNRGSITCRAILDCATIHIRDLDEDRELSPLVRALGYRSQISVPMLRDGRAIGAIGSALMQPGGLSDSQVALLNTFAEQAVIAISSAETFRALQTRTAELTRSVAELQALEEVLRAVNASLDLDTVLATIISRAVRLSRADEGSVYEYDSAEEVFRLKAAFGMKEDRVAALRERRIRLGETHIGRAAVLREAVQVSDIQADPSLSDEAKEVLRGVHAVLALPLLREERVVGGLVIRRRSTGDFAPETVALLQTFAAQSVLAIQNARLFAEASRARATAEAALTDLRRTQDRLVQTEKLASLGQLTAGIAHEIKNPLNFVNNFSELSVDLVAELREAVAPGRAELDTALRAEIDDLTETLQGNLEKIAHHGKRADSIVKNMLLHSRTGASEHRPMDLNALAEEALNLAYHGARAGMPGFNITLEKALDPAAGEVDLYGQEITRVLLNLIGNGFYAARKRAERGATPGFEPILRLTTRDLGDEVEIRVRDNGTGMTAAVREKIFEPFFTTKPAGEGTGLGLSLSHDIIVKQHGGQLSVDSAVDQFTEFVIILPRVLRAGVEGTV
jgi:GAF domain-containing protein